MKSDYFPEGDTPSPRDKVLQHAATLAQERGLAMLTIESVARRGNLRNTDVRRHFWHRHDLVIAVFKALLDRLQDRMLEAAKLDPLAHGRTGRAYLTLITSPDTPHDDIRLLTAFTVAMTHDRSISVIWHAWLAAQFDCIADPIDPYTRELVCLAIDGLRLQGATKSNSSMVRSMLLERLNVMTLPPCDAPQQLVG